MMKSDLVQSDQRTRATFLAQETVEWLRGLGYNDSLLTTGTFYDGKFQDEGYDRMWTVEGNIPISDVKRITVTVGNQHNPSETATVVFLHARAGH